jgi:hypothetical protein
MPAASEPHFYGQESCDETLRRTDFYAARPWLRQVVGE